MKFKKSLGIFMTLILAVGITAGFGQKAEQEAKKDTTTVVAEQTGDLEKPAGIFSAANTSIEQIEEGDQIAIPNDASNTARAYALLQKAGWIKLKDDIDLLSQCGRCS